MLVSQLFDSRSIQTRLFSWCIVLRFTSVYLVLGHSFDIFICASVQLSCEFDNNAYYINY